MNSSTRTQQGDSQQHAVRSEANSGIGRHDGSSRAGVPSAFVIDRDGNKLFRSACKARGVSEDHTAESAYLLIPENAIHGHILKCCHPRCRQSGRLFRYCVLCRIPVTKRSFHRRHDHGLVRYDGGGRPILPLRNGSTSPQVCTVRMLAKESEPSEEQAQTQSHEAFQGLQEPPAAKKRHRTNQSPEPPFDPYRLEPYRLEPYRLAANPLEPQQQYLEPTQQHFKPEPYYRLEPSQEQSDQDQKPEARPQNQLVSVVETDASGNGDRTCGPSTQCGALRPEEREWLRLIRERPLARSNAAEMSSWFRSLLGTAYPTATASVTSDRPALVTSGKINEILPPEDVNRLDKFDIEDLDPLLGDHYVPWPDETWCQPCSSMEK